VDNANEIVERLRARKRGEEISSPVRNEGFAAVASALKKGNE